jgi:hypothetical protein
MWPPAALLKTAPARRLQEERKSSGCLASLVPHLQDGALRSKVLPARRNDKNSPRRHIILANPKAIRPPNSAGGCISEDNCHEKHEKTQNGIWRRPSANMIGSGWVGAADFL